MVVWQVGSTLHSIYYTVVARVSIVVGGREYTQVARLQGTIATPWLCMKMGDRILIDCPEPLVQGLLLTAAQAIASSVAKSCG